MRLGQLYNPGKYGFVKFTIHSIRRFGIDLVDVLTVENSPFMEIDFFFLRQKVNFSHLPGEAFFVSSYCRVS